ncbi:DUF3320 domain-containing protein [Pseudoroseicyclus tamaricis]|uniref:DUF3320 domain-containing protein n=1 Tax=Pseudoroseicyclus tamaricis TaxID=2705421 RepID=A0A6B2JME2_9RHOB|nr:DUF3320 domain-containing protein [Pseudoroseicyclus tamaricis]NDU99816.1 DUF3320 domain-containing protein [Pseudoroseicyclus tamaricis]
MTDFFSIRDSSSPKHPGGLQLFVSSVHRVNFASAQNDVSILKSVVLRNEGDGPVHDLRVHLASSPAIFQEKSWTIDRIAPGAECRLSDLSTPLDLARLSGLDEAETGELTLEVEVGRESLVTQRHRIELLARDEWGGVGDMAHLLAAFVSPNDPVVARLLKEASRLLERSGEDGSLDGYQSGNPGRVWMLAGAIWSAATAMGLAYAVPPASFEREGQKIRGPERIASEGLATCLDTALLLAAAFEAAGLNPAVLFSEGHAWVGVWLTKRDFGHVTEPDPVTLRKAIHARDFVALETTLLTKRPAIRFEQAVDEGRRRLSEEREAEFVMAVDIARARAARIRPLASHREGQTAEAAQETAVAAALPKPLDLGLLPGELVEETPSTPKGRIERWQRKLLDLTLMNRLLNFKESKQTIPLFCPDVPSLEDALADGRAFTLLALRDDDPVGRRNFSPEERARVEEGVAADAIARRQIAVPLTGKEMNARLTTLFRKAKSDMAEGGTNTLFLAAGFLRWKKSEGDQRVYRAPILLIPARLERKSAQSEFRILHHEDDVRINSTLLEFLKRDFDLKVPELEGELPRDESGIDVPLILEQMRMRVRDVAGFEVVEELALSTFSFAKYLMWKDLVDRTDDLRQNSLVAHLVDNPAEPFQGHEAPEIRPDDLDRRVTPADLVTPLPADSSQLAAVVSASEGRDFVLIGPPGTGKSQTIANIVAQCLASGKTVLFVAEKAAALNVVHRRLSAQGLGDAVLELHSNKTDRKSVLSQLGRSWDRAARNTGAEWVQVTEDLRVARDRLNAYVEALHAVGTQGFSVFDAIAQLAGRTSAFTLSFASKDAHDAEGYRRLIDLAEAAGRTHAVAGEGPSLDLVDADDWSFGWEATFLNAAEKLDAAATDLLKALSEVSPLLGLPSDTDGTEIRRKRLSALSPRIAEDARDLSNVPDLPEARLVAERTRLAEALKEATEARRRLAASYGAEAADRAPLELLDADWRAAHAKFWPFSSLAKRRVRSVLQSYAEAGVADPGSDLPALQRLRTAREQMAASPLTVVPEAKGETADLGALDQLLSESARYRESVRMLASEASDAARLGQSSAALASLRAGPERDAVARLAAAESAMAEAVQAFATAGGRLPGEASLKQIRTGLAKIREERARLADWTRWNEARSAAEAAGLSPLIEALVEDRLTEPAAEAFKTAYAAWWLPLAMDSSEDLRRFAHWEHEHQIQTFRALDDAAARLAPSEVLRRIANGLPTRDGVPRNSELGTLRHQLGLQRPSMPIRSLLSEMPNSFAKLAPCVLMSPLSVAQYLPAGQPAFDVVIFDEASQITTWDAVGAIARGRQAIVVGDPKQMPPTNFFGRTDAEEDLPEVERDMPSILDEVCAAGIPTRRLDWHYRSRDEALIAFSNHLYYDGGLVTFPGPTTGSDALVFHKVGGQFDRGKSRTNEAEAKAVTAWVRAQLTEWLAKPEDERPTLGVITFNQPQQELIQDLLDEARRQDPRLEWFFEEEREEPLIVKNLENIQGDERDVMLFSVTYGRDAAGKLAMAFGPLNSDGGEKRLNVAVTRARAEMHVFASLTAHDIDLGRTRARGVADFKAFLDYAERGSIALPARESGSLGPAESPFEEAVAAALAAKGWDIRTQIGVSGFRIDLAVVNPDHAGTYLAGVECDGATYHSSATARDRDKIRQAVLEGLGWQILRVWSTDWFKNPADVVARLHAALEKSLEADRVRRESEDAQLEAEKETADTAPLALPAPSIDGAVTGAPRTSAHDDTVEPTSLTPQLEAPIERHATLYAEAPSARNVPESDASKPQPNPEAFYEASYLPALERIVASTIEADGPLPMSRLARSVAQLHGWQRTGHRIAARVETALGSAERHEDLGCVFVWPPGSYATRIPPRPLGDRSIRDVPPAEIASTIDRHERGLASAEDPTLDLARLLGIERLSKDAREYLTACMEWCAQHNA